MLKSLAMFGMLLVILGPNCHADQVKTEKSNQKPATPVLTIPKQQQDSTTLKSEKQKDIHADVKIVNPPEKDFYDKAPVWINLVLVVVALGTGIVIGWQAWETRKAAEASNRSIILQEAALRQWVNIVPLGIGISRTLKNPCEVSVQFEIQNRTDYLVTIKRVEYELIPNIHMIGKFKVECDFPVAPRKREDDSAFPFTGECVIDIGELDGWGKIFIVAGDVTFLDCMDRERVQHFQDLYRGFADGRLERMKPSSIESTKDKPEDPNPN